MMDNDKLHCYKFQYNVPRYGTLSGLFLSFERLKESTKYEETILFHDKLGKHSEIEVDWKECLEEISLTEDCMEELRQTFGMSISGIYLPDYLNEWFT